MMPGRLQHFVELTRLHKPIGIYLLLWPMLWALWFAAGGLPDPGVLVIFVLGTIITRSAGCAINDYADRHIDGKVARSKGRPLATGDLTPKEALLCTAVLMLAAFLLVLLTNRLTIQLSFVALALAVFYPFTKRFTHWPQLFLGLAFAFAVPMAFAAQTAALPALAWWLFLAAVLWAMAYDTLYAMCDRDDDLRIGVKSMAILFGRADLLIVGLLQCSVLSILIAIGWHTARGPIYYCGLLAAAGFVAWQLYLSRHREPQRCLQAFFNNHYLGMVVFIGIFIDFLGHPLP